MVLQVKWFEWMVLCSCDLSYGPLLWVLVVCDILERWKKCLYNIIIGGKFVFVGMIYMFFTKTSFLCRLKRQHIGFTFVGVGVVTALSSPSSSATFRFPCLEHNFVTLGPNHFKLGMHVSMQCQATHLFQWNKIFLV